MAPLPLSILKLSFPSNILPTDTNRISRLLLRGHRPQDLRWVKGSVLWFCLDLLPGAAQSASLPVWLSPLTKDTVNSELLRGSPLTLMTSGRSNSPPGCPGKCPSECTCTSGGQRSKASGVLHQFSPYFLEISP